MLNLKPMQDGMGFYYGHTEDGRRIDLLPPWHYDHPFFVNRGPHMHHFKWRGFVDGEQVSECRTRREVEVALEHFLTPSN
jgi:hypothetical protein